MQALEDVILRMSAMATDLPEIAEVDCNPVIVLDRGAAVVDARVHVRLPRPRPPVVGRTDV